MIRLRVLAWIFYACGGYTIFKGLDMLIASRQTSNALLSLAVLGTGIITSTTGWGLQRRQIGAWVIAIMFTVLSLPAGAGMVFLSLGGFSGGSLSIGLTGGGYVIFGSFCLWTLIFDKSIRDSFWAPRLRKAQDTGELDSASRLFRFSNSGCPYPYHYRAATGEVVELQVDAYPLGVRPDTTYRVIEVQLDPGDRVVFCSDGIIEATNAGGEMFGFERTAETVRKGCQEGLSAEGLLERIIQEVKAFSQGVPQGDDQTVVVLKVER